MSQVKISDIHAGKPDAKDDISRNKREFMNSYLIPPNLNVKTLKDGDIKQEEAERKKQEEAEGKKREEEERIEKERQEAEQKKKEQEEAERKKREEAERIEQERQEAERKKREEEERKMSKESTFEKPGSIVKFGRYPQEAGSTQKQPIEWMVLDVKEGRSLLISRYALDAKKYYEEWEAVTWETCTLRKWLNQDFLNTAFSEDERKRIPVALTFWSNIPQSKF